jgi:ubiquinone/menaquinone biosynthesis C-methylase UbiE
VSGDEAQGERERLRAIDDLLIDVKRRCYELMKMKSGARVLDAGCGLGLDVQRLQRLEGMSIDVVGIDLNYMLWQRSWEAVKREGASFAAAAAERLPFYDGTFDVVWADRLLQHVDDPRRVVLEFKRVSKRGGRIVLADSDHTSARILCNGQVLGQWFMDFRASTIKNGCAGRMLGAWCEETGLKLSCTQIIDLNIRSLELAKRVGLFFGGWDDKLRRGGYPQARELAKFLTRISKCDQSGAFTFNSKFHVVAALKR